MSLKPTLKTIRKAATVLLLSTTFLGSYVGVSVYLDAVDQVIPVEKDSGFEGLYRIGTNVFVLNGVIGDGIDEQVLAFRDAVKQASKNDERVLLKIRSPGGAVTIMENILDIMDEYQNVDTQVVGTAASAAAVIWLDGSHRYLSSTSLLLFHGISSGGMIESDFRAIEEILNDPRLDKLANDNEQDFNADLALFVKSLTLSQTRGIEVTTDFLGIPGSAASRVGAIVVMLPRIRHFIHGHVNEIISLNNSLVEFIYDRLHLNNPQSSVTKEQVRAQIVHGLKADEFFTKDQAKEIGLLAEDQSPDIEGYSKHSFKFYLNALLSSGDLLVKFIVNKLAPPAVDNAPEGL